MGALDRGLMARRGWMASPALSIFLLVLSASLEQSRAGAGPFSWGNRINFAKVAKANALAEDHGAPQVDWNEEEKRTRFPRQTPRFQPGSAGPELEMSMVMREIEKAIMDSIANRVLPFQQGMQSGVPGRRGGRSADFRRAFITLGRL